MMLERGAHFSDVPESCSPEMENDFLKRIMEFERLAENSSFIKVYDRIGRPTHFKPVTEIEDDEMDEALDELMNWLCNYDISVDVCSPNISQRELYRFIVDELFQHEINDVRIPGMVHGFVYDEFHPDPVFENSRLATEECIAEILQREKLEWMHPYALDHLQLNDRFPLSQNEFRLVVNKFKKSVTKVEYLHFENVQCVVEEKLSFAKGRYAWKGILNGEPAYREGRWLVNMEHNEELGQWIIFSVEIEGMEF